MTLPRSLEAAPQMQQTSDTKTGVALYAGIHIRFQGGSGKFDTFVAGLDDYLRLKTKFHVKDQFGP